MIMPSWLNVNSVSFFQLLCIKLLKACGIRIPRHIAFIMDGNRRFAKKYMHGDCSAGHRKGFEKLSESLKWCVDLGVKELTVYAFSIENFKRKSDEVNALMDLFREKFRHILTEIDAIHEWGVRVHVAGRLSLLPDDVQHLISQVMLATRNNNKLKFNIACAYTGRDEISRAVTRLMEGVKKNNLPPDAIDANLVSQALDIGEPELLIRTSGVHRLSDFMLWQVSHTVLYFIDDLWPEFTIWNVLQAIIHFHRHAPLILPKTKITRIQQDFLHMLEIQKWNELEKICAC